MFTSKRTLFCAALFLCLAWLFAPAVPALSARYQIDPNCSHGYVVPLLALGFARRARRESGQFLRRRLSAGGLFLATTFLLFGLALHFTSRLLNALHVEVIAFILCLLGTAALCGGRKALRAYSPAAGFLLFAAPLPVKLQQTLAVQLQQTVSGVCEWVLSLSGVAVLREGHLLYLPGHLIEVAEACSGLRQVTVFIAVACTIALWKKYGRWHALFLLFASLPVAILANCLRVLLSVFLLRFCGREWATGALHTLEGLGTVIIGLLLFLATARGLTCLMAANRDPGRLPGRKLSVAAHG